MGYLCVGLVAGLLLTPERRLLGRRNFWFGVGIAALLFLPHILWEFAHGFPSIEFMRNATLQKNALITPWAFLLGQFDETGKAGALLWLLGLLYGFVHPEGRQYRFIGWMYVAIFVLMISTRAKVYYLTPIYPALIALGAVHLEKWLRRISWRWLRAAAFAPVLGFGLLSLPFALPVLPVETFIRYQRFLGATPPQEERKAMGILPQYYADMFGWVEMVQTVAAAYDSLSPREREVAAISMNNYGEAAAIDFFGPRYGLPKAISGHNNYWLWGPRGHTGEVVIRLGGDEEKMRQIYADVRPVGTFEAAYCMPYENHQVVYVCRRRHVSLPDDWKNWKHFE
jgi:hypothetical protein